MVIWKKRNFNELGIIVEKTPKISKGKKRIDTFIIPGRNGFLSIDEGTYESFSLSLECHINKKFNLDDVCDYLDGYGTLSLDGKREYTAIINNSVPFEKVLMFKKFIVQFLVNPICEDINSTIYNVESDDTVLNIEDTYYEIDPILTITCEGNISVTINNETFHLDNANGTYILDCKNKVIAKDGVNASNIMIGNFPKLNKNLNTISYLGNIDDFKIEYKKTYLWGG